MAGHQAADPHRPRAAGDRAWRIAFVAFGGAIATACATDTGAPSNVVANTPPLPATETAPPVQAQSPPRRADPRPPVVAVAPPAIPATPGLSAKQRIKLALDLLSKGDADHAKPEIQAFLAEQPDNELGNSLLAQITQDPRVLLGAQSYPYKVQSGDTISGLAERFLDDRFKFYALARYNGIAVPSQAEVGVTLQIPGVPKRVVEARKPAANSDEDLIQSRVDPKRAGTPATAAPPVVASRPGQVARDAPRANALRTSALEFMRKGAIDKAVAQLQQALSFDPGNVAITRDLERARRILSGVR